MTFFYEIDKAIFLFLNGSLANPFFDLIMPYITEADYWKIPLFLAWLSLMIFGRKKGRIVGLMAIIILTLSDQLSSSVVKPLFGRIRPCFALENVRQLIGQPNSPSFPSSHAANNAAIATLFSVKYRQSMWIFIFIAVLVSYSRIYVGVHYPSDVLGGMLIGVLCGCSVLCVEHIIRILWQKRDVPHFRREDEEKK